MLCVIPLLVGKGSPISRIAGVKYFVSQRRASLVFIIRVLIRFDVAAIRFFTVLRVVFKLGLPPFHRWLLRILEGLGYGEMFIIFTIQKFIPLIILTGLKISRGLIMGLMVISLILILRRALRANSLFFIIFLSSVANGL